MKRTRRHTRRSHNARPRPWRAPRVAPCRDPNALDYLARVIRAANSGGIARAGQVTHITVVHDEACPHLRGGVCRCEPEIEASVGGHVYEVDSQGDVNTRAPRH